MGPSSGARKGLGGAKPPQNVVQPPQIKFRLPSSKQSAQCGQSLIPSESGSLTRPTADVVCPDPNQEHRRVYYEVVDRMHEEMSRRFSDLSSSIMLGIDACDPSKDTFMSFCVHWLRTMP